MTTLPLFPSHPTCTLCDYRHESDPIPGRHIGVPTLCLSPPSTDAVVFVGMNPGYHEILRNRPFCGPSGRSFHNLYLCPFNLVPNVTDPDDNPLFDEHGWQHSNLESARRHHPLSSCTLHPARCTTYLTNALRCGPEPTKVKSYYAACFPHTLADLSTIESLHPSTPRLALVALGAEATHAVTKHLTGTGLSLTDSLKKNGSLTSGRFTLFFTWHPAYYLRKRGIIYSIHDHLRLLSDFLDDTIVTPSDPHILPLRAPIP